MSKLAKGLIALICSLFVLSGCGGMLASKNNESIKKLNIGDTKETVISVMGQPKSRETFKGKEYWLYRTTGFASEEQDLYTPFVFENGKLLGWGKMYWSDIRLPPAPPAPIGGGGGTLVIPANLYNKPDMTPFMTNPSSGVVRGNTQPFQQSPPPQPIQNPSVNCTPNGMGGFRCQ